MTPRTLIAVATAAAFSFSAASFAQEIEQTSPQSLQEDAYAAPLQDAPPPVDDTLPATDPMRQDAPVATEVTDMHLLQALEEVGYTEVENVNIDPPMWSAEALNPQGDAVLVQIDPATATIVSEQPLDAEEAE